MSKRKWKRPRVKTDKHVITNNNNNRWSVQFEGFPRVDTFVSPIAEPVVRTHLNPAAPSIINNIELASSTGSEYVKRCARKMRVTLSGIIGYSYGWNILDFITASSEDVEKMMSDRKAREEFLEKGRIAEALGLLKKVKENKWWEKHCIMNTIINGNTCANCDREEFCTSATYGHVR